MSRLSAVFSGVARERPLMVLKLKSGQFRKMRSRFRRKIVLIVFSDYCNDSNE